MRHRGRCGLGSVALIRRTVSARPAHTVNSAARLDEQPATHGGRLGTAASGLHQALADEARREGVSLNHFVSSALSSALGWKR